MKSFRTDESLYGVFDMAGNAREWCLDWYSAKAYKEAASSVKKREPIDNFRRARRADPRYHRVGKGNGPGWVLWQRWALNMRERYDDVGFRTILNVPRAKPPEQADPNDKTTQGGKNGPYNNKPKSKNPGF